MNFLFPLISAFLQAGSIITDKFILSIRKIGYKEYTAVGFPILFVISLFIYILFRPPFNSALFEGRMFWILLLSIGYVIVTNLIFYRALDHDHLGEMQIVELMANIPVIIFSSLIFTDERNGTTIAFALIASLVLLWSHWDGKHFKMLGATKLLMAWLLLVAPFSRILAKELLEVWNPISLEVLRNVILGLFFGIFYIRNIKNVKSSSLGLFFLTNVLTSVAWILYFYSYQRFGIVYTVLVFSLQPLLVYLSSIIFFKEPLHQKKIIAFFVILASIALAQLT